MKTLRKYFGDMAITHVPFGSSLQVPQRGKEQSPAVWFPRLPRGTDSLHRTARGQWASSRTRRLVCECHFFLCCAVDCEHGSVSGEAAAMMCKGWRVSRAYGQDDRKLGLGIDDKQVNLLWVILWKQSLLYLFIIIIFFVPAGNYPWLK